MVKKRKDWNTVVVSSRCPCQNMGRCSHPDHPRCNAVRHPACTYEDCPMKAREDEHREMPEMSPKDRVKRMSKVARLRGQMKAVLYLIREQGACHKRTEDREEMVSFLNYLSTYDGLEAPDEEIQLIEARIEEIMKSITHQ